MTGFALTMRYQPLYLLLFCGALLCAQGNTLRSDPDQPPARANLTALSWLSGHWKGEALGGITEEVWTPPLGGSMMFAFKLVVNGEVNLYELGYIKELDSTLILQLKHFDKNLHAWEEKQETVDFPLVKVEGNRIYFEDFTIERATENQMNIYLIIGEEGREREVLFSYARVRI